MKAVLKSRWLRGIPVFILWVFVGWLTADRQDVDGELYGGFAIFASFWLVLAEWNKSNRPLLVGLAIFISGCLWIFVWAGLLPVIYPLVDRWLIYAPGVGAQLIGSVLVAKTFERNRKSPESNGSNPQTTN